MSAESTSYRHPLITCESIYNEMTVRGLDKEASCDVVYFAFTHGNTILKLSAKFLYILLGWLYRIIWVCFRINSFSIASHTANLDSFWPNPFYLCMAVNCQIFIYHEKGKWHFLDCDLVPIFFGLYPNLNLPSGLEFYA